MILFLADYPFQEKIKDGMFQRIFAIDNFFMNTERVYLNVSYRKNLNLVTIQQNEQVRIVKCNFFLHFLLIMKFFRESQAVYIHSVFYVLYNVIPIFFFFRKQIILDVHGAFPEERKMYNEKKWEIIFGMCEWLVFRRVKKVICITDEMVKYYQRKYPNVKTKYYVFTIMPKNLDDLDNLLDDRLLFSKETTIIYSGNIQVWQNVEIMIDAIQNNLHYSYIVLTGEYDRMIDLFKRRGIYPHSRILIKTVEPENLKYYYSKANYGFILRDDIIVNNVSCPTKIIEYMYHGIIPIVLSPKIGDFEKLDYEYVSLSSLPDGLPIAKSKKNVDIIRKLIEKNTSINIHDIVLNLI